MWVPSGDLDADFLRPAWWELMGRRYRRQNADFRPFRRQCQRQVYRREDLPTPPLPELTAMMFFTPLYPADSSRVLRWRYCATVSSRSFRPGDTQQFGATLLF